MAGGWNAWGCSESVKGLGSRMEEVPGTKGSLGERGAKRLGICAEESGTPDIKGCLGARGASDIRGS